MDEWAAQMQLYRFVFRVVLQVVHYSGYRAYLQILREFVAQIIKTQRKILEFNLKIRKAKQPSH